MGALSSDCDTRAWLVVVVLAIVVPDGATVAPAGPITDAASIGCACSCFGAAGAAPVALVELGVSGRSQLAGRVPADVSCGMVRGVDAAVPGRVSPVVEHEPDMADGEAIKW